MQEEIDDDELDFSFDLSKISEMIVETSESKGKDEDDLGDTEPPAFKLRVEDFKDG